MSALPAVLALGIIGTLGVLGMKKY
jgi:hypothetical protein